MTTPETAFREFRQHLSRFVTKRLDNPDDAEDILQEVFLRVVRNKKSLNAATTPLAWLYTVTRSVLIDHYRKKSRMLKQSNVDIQDVELPILTKEAEHEFDACLLPLVNNLPPKYRDAIQLTDLGGGKQTELAQLRDISLSNAKSRVQRGRKLLKQAIMSCCNIEHDAKNNVSGLHPKKPDNNRCC